MCVLVSDGPQPLGRTMGLPVRSDLVQVLGVYHDLTAQCYGDGRSIKVLSVVPLRREAKIIAIELLSVVPLRREAKIIAIELLSVVPLRREAKIIATEVKI